MNPNVLLFIAVSIIMTYFFIKRMGEKGCITFAYIGLLIFSINLFTFFSWAFMYSTSQEIYNAAFAGQQYDATVVDLTEEIRYDDESQKQYTMQTPIVEFTTQTGKTIEKTLDFSTTKIQLGDTYSINYDEKNDKVITLGFSFVLKTVASLIFFSIFTLLIAGIINFMLDFSMMPFYNIASKIGWYFLIPFLMICFDTLLLFGLFNGNTVPFWVSGILVFFIVVLSLGILGYFKMLFSKGEPKMTRTGAGSWRADWE